MNIIIAFARFCSSQRSFSLLLPYYLLGIVISYFYCQMMMIYFLYFTMMLERTYENIPHKIYVYKIELLITITHGYDMVFLRGLTCALRWH